MPARDHAERGLVDLADVVAVDLERQRPVVARADPEPLDAGERSGRGGGR